MPLFVKRPVSPQVVEATQLPPGAQASPTRGRMPRPGDWFVTNHSTGESYAMTADEFAQEFEPLAVPSTVLAAEHQAQQEQMAAQGIVGGPYRPEVTPDFERTPGYTGYGLVPPNPTLDQPMREDLPGRPSPTPEIRPRLGDMGENAPVETPTGIPAQPAAADAAAAEQASLTAEPEPTTPDQSPTGQPG